MSPYASPLFYHLDFGHIVSRHLLDDLSIRQGQAGLVDSHDSPFDWLSTFDGHDDFGAGRQFAHARPLGVVRTRRLIHREPGGFPRDAAGNRAGRRLHPVLGLLRQR